MFPGDKGPGLFDLSVSDAEEEEKVLRNWRNSSFSSMISLWSDASNQQQQQQHQGPMLLNILCP